MNLRANRVNCISHDRDLTYTSFRRILPRIVVDRNGEIWNHGFARRRPRVQSGKSSENHGLHRGRNISGQQQYAALQHRVTVSNPPAAIFLLLNYCWNISRAQDKKFTLAIEIPSLSLSLFFLRHRRS